MAHVRRFQTGPRGAFTQKLLNEIAAARVCLLSPAARQQYDTELSRRLMEHAEERRQAEASKSLDAAAAVELPPAADADNRDHGPVISPPANPRVSRSANRRKQVSFSWPATIVFTSAMLAILFAVGGWLLSRRSKLAPVPPPRPTPYATSQPPAIKSAGAAIMQNSSGEIELPSSAASLSGDVRLDGTGADAELRSWSQAATAAWKIRVRQPGFFDAEILYATTADAIGELELKIDDRLKKLSLRSTGGLHEFVADRFPIAVTRSGDHQLLLRVVDGPPGDWLALKSVRLVPINGNMPPTQQQAR